MVSPVGNLHKQICIDVVCCVNVMCASRQRCCISLVFRTVDVKRFVCAREIKQLFGVRLSKAHDSISVHGRS
jgi:hypothetical protein